MQYKYFNYKLQFIFKSKISWLKMPIWVKAVRFWKHQFAWNKNISIINCNLLAKAAIFLLNLLVGDDALKLWKQNFACNKIISIVNCNSLSKSSILFQHLLIQGIEAVKTQKDYFNYKLISFLKSAIFLLMLSIWVGVTRFWKRCFACHKIISTINCNSVFKLATLLLRVEVALFRKQVWLQYKYVNYKLQFAFLIGNFVNWNKNVERLKAKAEFRWSYIISIINCKCSCKCTIFCWLILLTRVEGGIETLSVKLFQL